MAMMGLSFTYPAMSVLPIPCLVVAGLSYGLGQGPPLSLVKIRTDNVLSLANLPALSAVTLSVLLRLLRGGIKNKKYLLVESGKLIFFKSL